MKYCFVVLHYLAEDDTYECIDSILKLYSKYDFNIVIVDNNSPDGSGERIKDKYKNDERITVLLEKKNNGFSKGNNIGYLYCKENLNPDYIIDTNNDVVYIDNNFLDTIDKLYKEKNFDVLGPDVLDPYTNESMSPIFDRAFSLDEIKTIQRNLLIEPYISKIKDTKLFNKAMDIFHSVKEVNDIQINDDFAFETTQGVIEGSTVIFSKKYIDKHDYAFYPMDSLYFEETILRRLLDKEGGIMLYSPSLKIHHKNSKSTKNSTNETKVKREFIRKNQIESIKTLLKIYEK